MTATASIYDSSRLAACYARVRPAVHPEIIKLIQRHLQLSSPFPRALDLGCGAGLSTAALATLAISVVGLEPVTTMLTHGYSVAPHAQFLVGVAEQLPFRSQTFDLITAAGSLNYVDLNRCFPEVGRVLKPNGTLVIYDFSSGRRFQKSDVLDQWFTDFEQRYPFPPGYEMDVQGQDYCHFGLRLSGYQAFEVAITLDFSAYLDYILSETNVELAIQEGESLATITDWCRTTLTPIFGDTSREILFDGYAVYVKAGG